MDNLFKNRRLSLSQFNAVVGAVLLEGILLSALIAKTCAGLFTSWNPIALVVVYLVVSIIGTVIARKSNRPALSLLGFNLVVVPAGAVLSVILDGEKSQTVVRALLVTAGVALVMIVFAQYKPNFFLKLRRVLTIAIISVIVIEVIMLIFGVAWSWWNVIVASLFALFIGYDWSRAQNSELTTDGAIDACVDLFIDLLNMFLRILDLSDND
jgi:FtsH-binding integral membrane protein